MIVCFDRLPRIYALRVDSHSTPSLRGSLSGSENNEAIYKIANRLPRLAKGKSRNDSAGVDCHESLRDSRNDDKDLDCHESAVADSRNDKSGVDCFDSHCDSRNDSVRNLKN